MTWLFKLLGLVLSSQLVFTHLCLLKLIKNASSPMQKRLSLWIKCNNVVKYHIEDCLKVPIKKVGKEKLLRK